MTPIRFRGYEKVLGAPANWDEVAPADRRCLGLPVAVDTRPPMALYSVWRLSFREWLRVLLGAKVVLHVVGGTHPVVALNIARVKEQK